MRAIMAVALALGASSAGAATTIDTSVGLGTGTISPFGEPNTATYGQTFTVVGSDTVLDDFSFRFDDSVNPDTIDFAAYVYGWDGGKATGPQLYASVMRTSTNNGGAGGFEEFHFTTGGVELVSGGQYVAFLNTSDFFDGQLGTSIWDYGNDTYSGGAYVYENNGSNFSSLLTFDWDYTGSSGQDTWFKASFSAPVEVPLPAALPLLLAGLGGLSLLRRRERKVA